ncbi:proline dehydrogenase [bacterium]|nr:proline dehydrogenase [bacterium]
MNLNFDNTEIAFAHKSDNELWKAKKLFQMFSNKFLVHQGPKLANIALSVGLPVKGLIKSTIFHQFCGGETMAECDESAKQLLDRGVQAILDYSVEGKGNRESYEHTFKELLAAIEFSAPKKELPFAVFKVSGIASTDMLEQVSEGRALSESEEKEKKEFQRRFYALCEKAAELDLPILVDAEESWIQKAIDEITYEAMAKFNTDKAIVYNTIQLYRKDRIPAINSAIENARKGNYKIGFKLVRGAYMEKEGARAKEFNYPNPIQDSKENTDQDYNDALKLCFENRDITSVCAGTHNEKSSYLLAELMDKEGISKSDTRFWFAQLYGMSDHISFNLAAQGFNVVKYLPYGPVKKVLPYLSRRAIENSSVKGQAGRELSLINKELERRKR